MYTNSESLAASPTEAMHEPIYEELHLYLYLDAHDIVIWYNLAFEHKRMLDSLQ